MLQVCSYLHLLSVWRSGTSLDFSGFWGKTLSPYLPMVIHITRRIKSVVIYVVNLVHFSSFAQSCPTVCKPRDCSMPAFPVPVIHSWSLLKLMSIESVISSNHLILYHSLLLPSTSQHQGLFHVSTLCIRWPEYWSFSISPSNEYSGLISFTFDR